MNKKTFDKILLTETPSKEILKLKKKKTLKKFLPEVDILWNIKQSPKWHSEGSVGEHTMMTLDYAREMTDDLTILWAALLHDTGKAVCTKIEDGKITAYNHEKESVKITENIMKRLFFWGDDADTILYLIKNHMRIKKVSKMKKKKVDDLITHNLFEKLRILGRADNKASVPDHPDERDDWDAFLENYINEKYLKELQDVFFERKFGSYLAGYLAINVDNKMKLFPITHPDLYSKDVQFWICVCYIKYRNINNIYYLKALDYVKNYHNTELSAKILLLI